jgi:hypothetical protein
VAQVQRCDNCGNDGLILGWRVGRSPVVVLTVRILPRRAISPRKAGRRVGPVPERALEVVVFDVLDHLLDIGSPCDAKSPSFGSIRDKGDAPAIGIRVGDDRTQLLG